MYVLPSMSVMRLPDPWAANTGVRPTDRNARTGLLTPPGIDRFARSKAAFDFSSLRIRLVSINFVTPVTYKIDALC